MASLSNINGLFDVHSTGAILFSTSHGLNGQILRSNGDAAPTWVAASTVIGGPYVPIAGDVTINGYITLAAGKILTVGGNLFVTGTSTLTGALSGAGATFSDNVSIGIYASADTGSLLLNGSTANRQSVLKCTNGNLHIDADSTYITYINYYTGSGGITFGNGAGAASGASVSSTGIVYATGGNSGIWNTHTSNTGTVTSVSGTGTVSGITLTGTVTSTGNLTLGGTLSASITNISNAANWWNNFGQTHGTRTGFDASTASYDFGWRYIQGNTNGPGTGGTQFYSAYVGLGSEYAATGGGSYGMYLAIDRNTTNPYLSIRYNEANVLGTWKRISAGTADILTTARTIAGVSFNGSANISLNNNAITNGAGYTTNTGNGTVTSVATGNGLTGGTIISTGTLTMSGSYAGKFTIDSTGDVEYLVLNTTSTTNKRVRLQFTQNDNAGMEIATDYSVDNSSNFYFYDRVAGSAMLFTSVASSYFPGSLRIGMTAASSQKLHVQGSNHFVTFENTSTTANHYSQMLLKAGTALGYIWTANQNSTNWGGPNSLNIYTGEAGAIAFFTTAVKRMTIQAAGNVYIETKLGIANSNPPAKLTVGPTVSSGATGISINAGVGEGNLIGIGSNNHNWFPFTNGQNYYSSDIHNFRNAAHSTTYMTLDSVGLGIGTASPGAKLEVVYGGGYNVGMKVRSTSGYAVMTLEAPASNYPILEFKEAGTQKWQVFNEPANDSLNFYAWGASAGTRLIILQSGNVGINNTSPDAYLRVDGTTTVTAARFYGTGGTRPPLELRQNNTAGWFAKFYSDNFGTYIGGISFYGSTTTFSTSSDYRLKENIIPISDSITRLKQLKPSRFNFKQYPEITIDGFLAHEVQDIVPEAITGDKDELDLNGKPVYQAIDHSRLIPLLVASIQELELRVKELENK
jgi:hypothetical protein